MRLLLNLLIGTIAVLIANYLIPGIHVESYTVAIIVAIVLGVLNAVLKPILVILTLPITILTLGLFTFVINAVIVLIARNIIPGFTVASFWSALLFSLVVSVVNSFLNALGKH